MAMAKTTGTCSILLSKRAAEAFSLFFTLRQSPIPSNLSICYPYSGRVKDLMLASDTHPDTHERLYIAIMKGAGT